MLLFFIGLNPQEGDLAVQHLGTGRREALGVASSIFTYSPSGHVMYQVFGSSGLLTKALLHFSIFASLNRLPDTNAIGQPALPALLMRRSSAARIRAISRRMMLRMIST